MRAVRVVRGVELGEERALAVERLDDGHAGDRLGDLRGHRRDRLAHAQERRVRAHLEPAGEDERRRQDHERDETEAPVEDEQADDRGEQRERVDDERGQPLREHVRERVDVGGEPRDDPARLLLREVAQRERRQVIEEVAAQAEHDVLADAGEPAHERRLQHPRERVDHQVEDHVAAEPCLVVALHALVDRVLHDQERGHRRSGGAHADHARAPRRAGGDRPDSGRAASGRCASAYARQALTLLAEERCEEPARAQQLVAASPTRRSRRRRARPRGRPPRRSTAAASRSARCVRRARGGGSRRDAARSACRRPTSGRRARPPSRRRRARERARHAGAGRRRG